MGAPAFDLGRLIGDCLAGGLRSGQREAARRVPAAILHAYEEAARPATPGFGARALAFAGAHMLRRSRVDDEVQTQALRPAGTRLLQAGLAEAGDLVAAMRLALAGA